MVSPELFLMQAEKVCIEVFEHLSDDIFSRIELKSFSKENESENAKSFTNIIKREQISSELEKANEKFFISEAFEADDKINFFVIIFNKDQKKNIEKYFTFYEKVITQLFEYLINEYKNCNSYFYNSTANFIIIRAALDNLVTEISRKSCNDNGFSLYDNINFSLKGIINELSFLTYEKNSTEGLIYFTSSPENADFQFKFENYEDYGKFDNRNLKLLRKLLELTSKKNEIGIISDTNNIYGIGSIKDGCDFFSVSFDEDQKWTICENETELVTVRNNSLIFVNSFLSKKEFSNYVRKIFPTLIESDKYGDNISSGDEIGNMYSILKSLIKQGKGTILVVKKDAAEFIKKYQDLCIIIAPVKLDEKNVEKLSSIDGAIIMDEKCVCYGFGVVLDGLDTGLGNRARGSRFNSSERFYNLYKNEKNEDLMVFILSDDGNFNLFPTVR